MTERILILIFINLCFYLRTLPYKRVIDDQKVPLQKGKNWLATFIFQLHAYRYSNRYVERAQRIAVHTINCVLIYLAFGCNDVAFLAAALFAINPSNNQGAIWLNGIGYSMSLMCVLLMIYNPWFATIPYLYSLCWHLTPIFAPLLFIKTGDYVLVYNLVIYVGICMALGWKVPVLKAQKDATLNFRIETNRAEHMTKIYLRKMVFVVKTYAYYTLVALFPMRLGLYHIFGFSFGLAKQDTKKWLSFSGLFWLGLGMGFGSLYVIVYHWGSPIAFGLFWYHLFIAQCCNFIMLQQPVAERYLYLPNAGLMYALVSAFDLCPDPVSWLLYGLFFGGYALKLWQFTPAYRNMNEYIRYSLHDFQKHHALWLWQGILNNEEKKRFNALSSFATGLKYRPHDFKLNFNLAQTMLAMGFAEMGLLYLEASKAGLEWMSDKERAENCKLLDKSIAEIQAEIKKQKNAILQKKFVVSSHVANKIIKGGAFGKGGNG